MSQRYCCKFARNCKFENRAQQHTYNNVFIGYLYVKHYLLGFQCSYVQLKIVKRKNRL